MSFNFDQQSQQARFDAIYAYLHQAYLEGFCGYVRESLADSGFAGQPILHFAGFMVELQGAALAAMRHPPRDYSVEGKRHEDIVLSWGPDADWARTPKELGLPRDYYERRRPRWVNSLDAALDDQGNPAAAGQVAFYGYPLPSRGTFTHRVRYDGQRWAAVEEEGVAVDVLSNYAPRPDAITTLDTVNGVNQALYEDLDPFLASDRGEMRKGDYWGDWLFAQVDAVKGSVRDQCRFGGGYVGAIVTGSQFNVKRISSLGYATDPPDEQGQGSISAAQALAAADYREIDYATVFGSDIGAYAWIAENFYLEGSGPPDAYTFSSFDAGLFRCPARLSADNPFGVAATAEFYLSAKPRRETLFSQIFDDQGDGVSQEILGRIESVALPPSGSATVEKWRGKAPPNLETRTAPCKGRNSNGFARGWRMDRNFVLIRPGGGGSPSTTSTTESSGTLE